jgi:hypothetical protein
LSLATAPTRKRLASWVLSWGACPPPSRLRLGPPGGGLLGPFP